MNNHTPVFLNEVLSAFENKEGEFSTALDVTFGRGGHTSEIVRRFPGIKVTALDRDPEAIEFGNKEFGALIEGGKLKLVKLNFHDLPDWNPKEKYDGILCDLGVSSPQLDNARRGFSFSEDGPLDMRMDTDSELTAAEILNEWSEGDLTDLFQKYGELNRPGRVVRAIVADRKEQEWNSTLALANMIARVDGWRKKGRHPATKYFMALRMAVNNELEPLESAMEHFMSRLNPYGRLVVITFHSLEDRIVKWVFRESKEMGKPVNKKVIKPTREEELANPRARSAKLRVFERSIENA